MRENRRPDEIRSLSFELDYLKHPSGSVLVSMGDTRVLCTVTTENKAPLFAQEKGMGWITSEYAMIPGATDSRTQRAVQRGRQDGRSTEIQRLIGRCLRSVTDLRAIPERTLWVDCDVLQADGGTRTASITGSFVALVLAFTRFIKAGQIVRWPLKTWLGAVSAGIVDGNPFLDLDYSEDSRADLDLNLIATSAGEIVEIQGTAEAHPFSKEAFQTLTDLAARGIEDIICKQKEALAPYLAELPNNMKKNIPGDF